MGWKGRDGKFEGEGIGVKIRITKIRVSSTTWERVAFLVYFFQKAKK